ncbi:NirA family protein [Methyloraptor flagellatus]|uniref:NirA family protein n=1 Tax=Methyloraptor flagellatus TaxID=3162530 RepID=A0AAU7X6W4_9HYPH
MTTPATMGPAPFDDEQKRYLEGFVSGVNAARIARGAGPLGAIGATKPAGPGVPTGPDAPHLIAQAKVEAAGRKLAAQEIAKRDEHPLDAYLRLKTDARAGKFPKPMDDFRWRFHGLFYVAPAQDSFMCRLKIPNGIVSHWQFRAVADLARRFGGGYTHVTTRANLQIREIPAAAGPDLIEGLYAAGLAPKGSGSDNIRNVTGSATAGIDPRELLDTRPHAIDWHQHVINSRTLMGLPRKFNVAFDGGGPIPVLEDTNDIAFQAVAVKDGFGVEPGIWYRLALGGITGHKDFARDTGVVVRPDEATAVADAIVRVYIDHGDRTDRKKARFKYVLDTFGFDKVLSLTEEKLGRPLLRVPTQAVAPRENHDRFGHVGVHPQAQPGLNWIGVVLPVGKLTCAQMDAIAAIAQELGDGDIRLTVWQNLLISGVADDKLDAALARIAAIGLSHEATSVRAGLVACTGNRGCKFASADTKGHALQIADWLDARVALDQPLNIHVTGCHHSCAQHYIGDIGLISTRVAIDPDGEDTVEGYHILVGGGFGSDAAIAREIYASVPATDCPAQIEALVRAYLVHRAGPPESFHAFTARHDVETLKRLAARASETLPTREAAE